MHLHICDVILMEENNPQHGGSTTNEWKSIPPCSTENSTHI